MKVVVIGSNGQLGSDLVQAMGSWNVTPISHQDIEICDYSQTRNILTGIKPDVVINTAAYHRVDECEDSIDKSFEVNAYAVRNLSLICRDVDSVLVHISTNYVFNGEEQRPYSEEDAPCPLNVYGVSKLAGEHFVQGVIARHFIIRSAGLYGTAGSRSKGGNFVDLMVERSKQGKPLRVVNDQVLTPTFTQDLARKITQLIGTGDYGTYHIAQKGECSWYEFAVAIFEMLGCSPNLSPATSEQVGAKARRPRYSVLANARLMEKGIDDMRHWRDALRSYLDAKGCTR